MPSAISSEEYLVPHDSDERLRLEGVQTLFRDFFNDKNILVPLSSSPSVVVDIGRGFFMDDYVMTKELRK